MSAVKDRAPASSSKVKHQPSSKVKMEEFVALSQRSNDVVNYILSQAHPEGKKEAPLFSTGELREILGQSDDWLNYRLRTNTEPQGTLIRNRLMFTLEQVQEWSRRFRADFLRPKGSRAKVIAMGNFKGGSCKTTSAKTLAQGLAMRGHNVLLADGDPQGSASLLCAVVPGPENEIRTLLDVVDGTLATAEELVVKTYWSGLDLIPACKVLAQADTLLPMRAQTDADGNPLVPGADPMALWWETISNALEPLRDKYDVIIIDTPPTLSPLAASLFMAADAMVVPIIPSALDFASSSEFWGMFSDFFAAFEEYGVKPKEYDFLKVLLTRVEPHEDGSTQATSQVIRMIQAAYGDYLLPCSIPRTSRVTSAAVRFGTVFDRSKYRGTREDIKRATAPYMKFVVEIERALCEAWAADLVNGDSNE